MKRGKIAGLSWTNIDLKNGLIQSGSLLNSDTITDWFSKFIDKNKLDKITVHGLRHTHATLLASNNMDIPALSARLGHADTNITNQYYVHSINSRDKIASDKIEQILS